MIQNNPNTDTTATAAAGAPARESENRKASTLITQGVTARFFQALRALIEMGAIKNKSAFPQRYGINRRNFEEVYKQYPRFRVQLDWLVYLSRDYGVAAQWLLLGEGRMMRRHPEIVVRRQGPVNTRLPLLVPPEEAETSPSAPAEPPRDGLLF